MSNPQITQSNYYSYMVSKWNLVFRELGYHELDVIDYEDGSWSIIQFHRSPCIPALTPWSYVLTNIKHVEKNRSVFKKYTDQLDLEKRWMWDQVAASERRMHEELDAEEARNEYREKKLYAAVTQNPDLMNRIAKNGIQELRLSRISRHIPNHRFRRSTPKCSSSLLVP